MEEYLQAMSFERYIKIRLS